MKLYLSNVSKNHVLIGLNGGFTQADHGKNSRLKNLAKGDYIIFYSPRTEFKGGESLQKFTAIGQIIDDHPFQVEMTPTFHPWRRKVQFFECREAPVKELIQELSFIKNKKQWGFPFRRGLFSIEKGDYDTIATAMGVKTSP